MKWRTCKLKRKKNIKKNPQSLNSEGLEVSQGISKRAKELNYRKYKETGR